MQTDFWKDLEQKHMRISLEYHGVNDIATRWEISMLLNNREEALSLLDEVKKEDTYTLYDFLKFLFLRKIGKMSELIPHMVMNGDRAFMQNLTQKADKILSDSGPGDAIRYINKNVEFVFSQGDRHPIEGATIDFIQEYLKGISPKVIEFLSEKYGYLIIQRFSDFESFFENHIDAFERLFSEENLEIYLASMYEGVLDILLHIRNKSSSRLGPAVDKIDSILYRSMKKQIAMINAKNVFLIKHQLDCYVLYLKKIKSPRANEFQKNKKDTDRLAGEQTKKNGVEFSYPIPTKEIMSIWSQTEFWETKLLSISHDYDDRGWKSVKSRLANDIASSFALNSDFFTCDDQCDDFFTPSRKVVLSIKMSIGTAHILEIIQKDYDEFQKLALSAIHYLSSKLISEEIEHDVRRMLLSVDIFRRVEDKRELVQEAYLYGVEMQICGCIEKMVRLAYSSIFGEIEYIPANKATLGSLLKDRKKEWLEAFDDDHLRILGYYLINTGEKEIGYNYRNCLAHMNDNLENMLFPEMVGTLLYLFTDVLNTLFAYYNRRDEIERKKRAEM